MDINYKDTQKLQKQIIELSERGMPIAIQQTLTATARAAWRYGRENTEKEFRTRNNWTRGSQTYQRAEGLDVNKMKAVTGSGQQYMAEQEEGFTQSGNGGNGVWVPTAEASDQSGIRTKPITRKYRKGRIKMRRKIKKRASSAAQQQLFNIYNAVTTNGFFWGKLKNTNGMWRMTGSVVNGKILLTGVRLLYSANKKTIRTEAHKWHMPAVERAIRVDEGDEYYKALKRQISRLRRKHGV